MTDRSRRRAGNADPSDEDNPFAAPPEGRPDRPWQPRRPGNEPPEGSSGEGPSSANGPGHDGSGQDGSGQDGPGHDGPGHDGGPPHPGGLWSPTQPGRHDGGFGGPGRPDQGGGGRRPGGLRWDPTDPKQRHARYALHTGIWGLFFALFSLTEIALLLGALSVYWGISALRGPSPAARHPSGPATHATAADVSGSVRKADDETGRPAAPGGRADAPQVAVTPAQAAKARTTAAVSGLVAGALTLLLVAGSFGLRMVYDDYFGCRADALTQSSREQCGELLPENIRPWLEDQQ